MNDFSILLIKPEAVNYAKEIIKDLNDKGYNIIDKKNLNGYSNFAGKIYEILTSEQVEEYIKGYKVNNFGDDFIVLILAHNQGDTIRRLKIDKGDWKSYQTNPIKGTLRSKFGLPECFNRYYDGAKLVYCGVHSPHDYEELKKQAEILGITDWVKKYCSDL